MSDAEEHQHSLRNLETEELFFLTYRWLRRIYLVEMCLLVVMTLLGFVITIHLFYTLTH